MSTLSLDELKKHPHKLREIAVAAGCHPETLVGYLGGHPVRSTSRARIEAALERLGIEPPSRLRSVREQGA